MRNNIRIAAGCSTSALEVGKGLRRPTDAGSAVTDTEAGERSQRLQTVERALRLLSLFTVKTPEWGLSDAARELGLPKSVTFRLVETLAFYGYLSQNPENKRYRLGLQVLSLASIVAESLDLRQVALPYMNELARLTGESVFLIVVENESAVTVAKVDSDNPVRVHMTLGNHVPLTLGASNKALLAFLPPERVEKILSKPVPPITGRSPADPAVLRQELKAIRARGWAYTVGEVTPDVAGLGVPILDRRGTLLGGITLGGPVTRLTKEKARQMVPELQRTTRLIATALGDR